MGRMKLALALLALASYQVSADGSFTGELACYGHLNTDVSTPEGGGYLELGQILKFGLGTTMIGATGLSHTLSVRVISGTRRMTWALDTALAPLHTAPLPLPGPTWRRRGASLGVDMPAVWGQSPAMDFECFLLKK